MSDETIDPRETPWHPRHSRQLLGHSAAIHRMTAAFKSRRMHHAWLLTGPEGVGKSTFAYAMAKFVLSGASIPFEQAQEAENSTNRWIGARSHPDMFVLEPTLSDRKPVKVKSEIAVDDARALTAFFARTSSNGWRVAIVDAADNLSRESANALLKLIEEPPSNCLILLISHRPGAVMRTLKSRCLRLPFSALDHTSCRNVLNCLPIEEGVREQALQLETGSPGTSLRMAHSEASKAIAKFPANGRTTPEIRANILSNFTSWQIGEEDFETFSKLLNAKVASLAKSTQSVDLASKFAKSYLSSIERTKIALAYNLDRRQALNTQLTSLEESLKGN
jgi:DNA polymerase III subunit delta'